MRAGAASTTVYRELMGDLAIAIAATYSAVMLAALAGAVAEDAMARAAHWQMRPSAGSTDMYHSRTGEPVRSIHAS